MLENWDQYKDLEYYPDRVCGCGCNGRIRVGSYHKYYGIPNYISGHNRTGSKLTKEHKEKFTRRGRKNSKEHNDKVGAALKGRPLDHKLNCRCCICKAIHGEQKGKNKLPRIKKVCPGCGIEFTTPTGTQERKFHTQECYWKYLKELWRDLEFVKVQREAWNHKPTKPEKCLDKFLQQKYPNQWKYVGDGSFWMRVDGGFVNPDFININGQKKIIELFGAHWHKLEEEQQRIDLFAKYGYQTLVIWDHELKNIDKIKDRLLQFSQ